MANTPAISVVIPMYNAERYIGECLDSILAQTFQDFEVILVNDGSTDSSRQIVEGYLEKFDGRLKIYDNEKNLGAGATRNIGLLHASGEWVFFMDADDLILTNALEKMNTISKYFNAEVVNLTRSYKMNDDGKELIPVYLTRITPKNETFVENNLKWRIEGLLEDRFSHAPWRRLLRREFLIQSKVFFPENVKRCEDEFWTHAMLFFAKGIVHAPLAVYIQRMSKDSVTRMKRTASQNIVSRMDSMIRGLKWLEEIMREVPFLKVNPQLQHAILEHSMYRFFERIFKERGKTSGYDMYKLIEKEFEKFSGEYELSVPLLCTLVISYRKIIAEKEEKIAELEEKLNAK